MVNQCKTGPYGPYDAPHVVAHPWGCIWGGVQGRKQWALVGHQSLFAGIESRALTYFLKNTEKN